jgi:peptidoglycan-N-acetylglucosamine deacetylase
MLSVVVPVKGTDMRHLVLSLNEQTIDPRSFELIVVRESGTEIDPELFLDCSFDYSVIAYERRPGFTGHSAGAMRNVGIRRAAADRVVFIDADCMLSPSCLARHVTSRVNSVALCGLARELPATLQERRFRSCSHDERWVLSTRDQREALLDQTRFAPATWQEFYTCNASAPRDLLIRAGMFDEIGYRCHDLDLGYRMHLIGCRFVLDGDCEVLHFEHPRSVWFRQEQIKGWSRLGEKHPELCVLTQDKGVALLRAQRRTLDKAEARFKAVTRSLPGIRCGSTWVLPESTPPEIVRRALDGIPFARVARRRTAELFLRLEKNCWDYSLLLPEPVTRPAISVVIAAHNAEATIARAVESVLRQREQSFEIVVVDDGSADYTARVLVRYFGSKRLRILANNSNRGLAHCLNRALDACRGTLLLQLDADDWLETDALEKLTDLFEANLDVGAIHGASRVHAANGRAASEPRLESGFPVSTAIDCLIYPRLQACRTYRVDALKAVGGWKTDDAFEGRYFEDRVMLASVAEEYRILYTPEPLYNVTQRRESLSRKNPLRAASAKLAILYGQAALRGMTLSYSFNGSLVSAKNFASPPKTEPGRWSVIIPFCGPVEPLLLALKSWAESDIRDRIAEIIVVVDGGESAIDPAVLPGTPVVRFLQREERGGPAVARNAGARVARYEWLFFSDSDRIVPPNVLRMHEARHAAAARPALVVADVFGRRTFAAVPPHLSPERKRRLLEMTQFRAELSQIAQRLIGGEYVQLVDSAVAKVWPAAQRYAFTEAWQARWGEILLQYGEDLKYFPHKWLRVGAGSVSMTRSTFDQVGGFDETFKAMEDWEFGIRTQELGIDILCAPEAEPLHQVHPVVEGRLMAEARGRARLVHKHPAAVDQLRRASSELIPPGGEQFVSASTQRESQRAEQWIEVPAPSGGDQIVLSFDDGPHDHYSELVLDALAAVLAPAAFFVLGHRAQRSPHIIRRLVRAGHEVGIHGWQHQSWSNLTRDELLEEISRTKSLIEDLAGCPVKFCRPPYGILPNHAASACAELGLRPVGWHLSSRDWAGLSVSETKIELAIHPLGGKIILFHDGYGNPDASAAALRWLVPACQSAGIAPVHLTEYLVSHEAPASP